ncbi:MAG: CopG family transcriptional regulator [SAR202 cluster bacterium]|nr:CopG family transcriptional regulator [SAR202 cluster bacterium]
MPESKAAKVAISLPKDLLEVADRLAKERSTTRSAVIVDLLKKEEEARIQALMEEGYREMAEENRRIANEFFEKDVADFFKRTKWDEPTNG